MAVQLPPCPASLRAVQHYLKTASDYDQRDPAISYWCRLYALQSALKIDKSSIEAKKLLGSLMDWLEKQKKVLGDNESISNDIAAQAYIENAALKLFYFADGQDRAACFGKDVVKAFYTAGMLFDVLQTFGELSEEIVQNRKYAKWKAAYIHKCLKNGEQPVPGPMQGDDDDEFGEMGAVGGYQPPGQQGFQPPGQPGFSGGPRGDFNQPQAPDQGGFNFPEPSSNFPPPPANFPNPPSNFPNPPSNFPDASNTFPTDFPPASSYVPSPHSNPYNPPTTPNPQPNQPFPSFPSAVINPAGLPENKEYVPLPGGAKLTADQMTKAQKYCKWAGSALSYDDVPTAISNMKKALKLLETGVDS